MKNLICSRLLGLGGPQKTILDELGIKINGEGDQKPSLGCSATGESSTTSNNGNNKRKTKRSVALGKKAKYDLGEEGNDDDSGSDFRLSDDDEEETDDDDFEEVDEELEEEFNPFGEGESDDEDPWARESRKKGRPKKKRGKKKSKKPPPPDPFAYLFKKEKVEIGSSAPSASASGTATPTSYVPPPQTSVDRACQMKEDILRRIEHLGSELPPNTLDQLIDELGGPENVSEMTGRKGRVVQDQSGDVRYESRSEQVTYGVSTF